MVGYTKGTTPQTEMTAIREAFARAIAAIHAWPNITEMWAATNELSELTRDMQRQLADYRGYLAAHLLETRQVTTMELAAFLGVSHQRVSQMVARARRRGNPLRDPNTLPEQRHVALAVITSNRGVLIAKRRDGIPPWTFLGGEILENESFADALRRRVQAEAGLTVVDVRFIGRRIHPKTSRVMVYAHVDVEPGEPIVGDPEDLEEVRWVSIDETRTLMPDMYPSVRQYLDELQRQQVDVP